jgi:hypothetical protein
MSGCGSCGSKKKCNCPEQIPGPIGLTGPQGPQGPTGDQPAYEWNGTQIRFENPDGSWGPWVNLQGPPGPCSSGTQGLQGPQGPAGPAGPSGPAGVSGPQGIEGPIGPQGPAGPSVILPDSGWQDLLGFEFYTSQIKPQARRIGNIVYFRGTAIIPLSSTADGLTLEDPAGYISEASPYSYIGVGGVDVNTNGSLIFNDNNPIIPPTLGIVPTAGNYFDSIRINPQIAIRIVDTSSASDSIALSAWLNVQILANGKLQVVTLKDPEIASGNSGLLGSSHLRYITSNIRSGENVPDYNNAGSDIHNFSASGLQPVIVDASVNTYTFSCDASLAEQVGGFAFTLDGLTSFIV